MLTDLEKQKIALLRSRFTDEEWGNLHSSDDYARERIEFYSKLELESLGHQHEMATMQQQAIDRSLWQLNVKINILTKGD